MSNTQPQYRLQLLLPKHIPTKALLELSAIVYLIKNDKINLTTLFHALRNNSIATTMTFPDEITTSISSHLANKF